MQFYIFKHREPPNPTKKKGLWGRGFHGQRDVCASLASCSQTRASEAPRSGSACGLALPTQSCAQYYLAFNNNNKKEINDLEASV